MKPRHCPLHVSSVLAAVIAWSLIGRGIAVLNAAVAEPQSGTRASAEGYAGPVEVDIATFARVVTSDPKRMTGTAAGRVQEFPAEDIVLETDLPPDSDGSYTLPVAGNGATCIGLRWYEMRFLSRLELRWADTSNVPPVDSVQLQYWVGASPWQGEWKPLNAAFASEHNVWRWQIAEKDQTAGTYRVRWVFSALKQSTVVKRIAAFGRSKWLTADLRAEMQRPAAGKSAPIAVYNGALLAAAEMVAPKVFAWDLSKPVTLKVCYSQPQSQKVDRTVLRFELREQTVSVAVEDVLAHGYVYVPTVGLFVTGNPPKMTLAEYLREIAAKKTTLDDVRSRPDQTFAAAMAITHNSIQEQGPMLLSLACDNRKFVADGIGPIRFDAYDTPDGDYDTTKFGPGKSKRPYFQLVPQFGAGKGMITRHLDGGWLPKPVTVATDSGVRYRQCSYMAPIDARPPDGCPSWYRLRAACVVDYTIENTLPTETDVALSLKILNEGTNVTLDNLQEVKDGFVVVGGQRVQVFFDAGRLSPLKMAKQTDAIGVSGRLAGGGSARLTAYLPAWRVKPEEHATLSNATRWAPQAEQYWDEQLASAMQIDIPDPLLANVIRASQVHCLLAAHNEDRGRYIAPWISAVHYGPLESESQAVIRGMDMCGQSDFARRSLEFFLKRYNSQGFVTTGYTLVGTGEHLWTLAEHVERCADQAWLKTVAPQLVRACQWIAQQRAKTMREDAGGKPPEYGLMPPGVTADWERYAYRLFNDAQYCHGLEAAARQLAAIGHSDAPALAAEAEQYRADLLRAYRWMQARCPVVPLGNGRWTVNQPAMLDVFGNVEEMVPTEDGDRSWCYSVELGAHHLAANRLLDPRSDEVARMMDYLEDQQFLRSGWGDNPEQRNRDDAFNLGGFSKVQPYYARNAEIYAMRDDVKPFIRSYFNVLSTLLNTEILSLWEHFNNGGAWNKTHETGWFLCQTATMFVMNRGDELWLAPCVTNNWLKDGMVVAVRNAPTRFGPVGFTITSHVAKGYIEASIEPPTRTAPKHIVLRIRHPDGKRMKSVTVNGRPHADFDPTTETIQLAPAVDPLKLRVDYE